MELSFDFADVKPNIHNLLIVGIMAVIFIGLAKWGLNKYPVKGLTELINAV